MGAVNQLLSKHNVEVRRGRVDIHRDQAIVERFNRTLAERLFGHQYGVEMRLPEDKRSTEWVARLPAVISALNKEVTRLTGQKPVEAIKKKTVPSKPSTLYLRPVGVNEKNSLPVYVFAISTNPVNLKVDAEEQLTQYGLWKFTRLKRL